MYGRYISTYPPAMGFIHQQFKKAVDIAIISKIIFSVTDDDNIIDIREFEAEQFKMIPKLKDLGVVATDAKGNLIMNPLVAFPWDDMPYHLVGLFSETPIFEKFADHFFVIE